MGRFINGDDYTSTGQGVLGNNMFAYCGSNPTSRSDSEGTFWSLVAAIVIVAATVHDLSQLMVQGSGAISASYTPDKESVQISNSNKIITPWVQYGYSAYLNHFSEYKDYFKGSTLGMRYEWTLHNLGALGFDILGAVFDSSEMHARSERCKDVDLGPTIFDDSVESHGAFSTVMKVAYLIKHPRSAICDFIAYQLS